MYRVAVPALCLSFLAACTDGTGGGIGPGGSLTHVPTNLSSALSAVSYNADSETITLRLSGIDGGPQDLNYRRRAALDVGPYQAYTYQDDPLDRHFTVLAAESHDGSVQAGVTADGGLGNEYFRGGFYVREGNFDAPPAASGQVEYGGSYAGITNLNTNPSDPGYDLLPVPAGTDPAIQPGQGARVAGRILINANFTEGLTSGIVFDRAFVDNPSITLPDLALLTTGVENDGSFFGDIEFDGTVGTDIGDYGGMFAGVDASSVGGVLFLIDVDNTIYGWEGDQEVGVFVLTQCGQPGEDVALCDLTR
ncbi:thymidylate synthase [Thalassovita sp.]|jgi:hypothetical protein|uniref:thymidylate synthase n=1 Tax=Thalassovita sp. TaxID=1979401 RepID=UPI003B59F85F